MEKQQDQGFNPRFLDRKTDNTPNNIIDASERRNTRGRGEFRGRGRGNYQGADGDAQASQ